MKFSIHINDDDIKKIKCERAAQTSSLFMTLRMWCDLGEKKSEEGKVKIYEPSVVSVLHKCMNIKNSRPSSQLIINNRKLRSSFRHQKI